MKVSYGHLLAALLIMVIGSKAAAASPIMNTTDFVAAIESASTNRNSPTTIQVHKNAAIDFDDGTTNVGEDGLSLESKYFRAICHLYDETNKCTLQRSAGGGRFFTGPSPLRVSFEGFEFIGGSSATSGGAFAFKRRKEGNRGCDAVFTNCDFVNNTASERGGAVYIQQHADGETASSLTCSGCTFAGNSASSTMGGGGIYTGFFGPDTYFEYRSSGGRPGSGGPQGSEQINLYLTQTIFWDNLANGNANDISGDEFDYTLHVKTSMDTRDGPVSTFINLDQSFGEIDLMCTETVTASESRSIFLPRKAGRQQTCSDTAAPSNAPSTPFPSSSPSVSASPSSAPTVGWETITYDNFENDWIGTFIVPNHPANTIGKNGKRIVKASYNWEHDYIPKGNSACRIRKEGFIQHRDGQDVTHCSKLRVHFWFKTRMMNNGDSFVVEYSKNGGSSWKVMKRFDEGRDFQNDKLYKETVDFDETGVNYDVDTKKAKVRFRCKGGGRQDIVYIDEIEFEGYLGF